jgi:hypothetical protein
MDREDLLFLAKGMLLGIAAAVALMLALVGAHHAYTVTFGPGDCAKLGEDLGEMTRFSPRIGCMVERDGYWIPVEVSYDGRRSHYTPALRLEQN